MYIIGHRCARGLELDNTSTGLRRAISLGVNAVEFDVRPTKDGQIVLCHDADLSKVAGRSEKVESFTLQALQHIQLRDGSRILSLEEAIEIAGDTPVIIDVKDGGYEQMLLDVLRKFPKAQATVISYNHQFLINLKHLNPKIRIYLNERIRPIEIIHLAKEVDAAGLNLHVWLLNPLTYWLTRRAGLELMVYNVNSPRIARFINFLYPQVRICTDYPDRFVKRRRRFGKFAKTA